MKLDKPAEVSVHMERVSQLQTEGVSLGGSGSKPLGLRLRRLHGENHG